MGMPLRCVIEPKQTTDAIQLNFKLIGKAGECYNPRLSYAPDANQPSYFQTPDQPSFTIIGEQGMIIHEGQFEYG
jgi:hypothetical protein